MFCLCIFESDTVKSDCPIQILRKIIKYLIQTVGFLYYCLFWRYLKKAQKMTSQLVIFRAFLCFLFVPYPKSENKFSKSTIKNLALPCFSSQPLKTIK